MKRFLVLCVLLFAPSFASAKLLGDVPKTTVRVEKQSRRIIRSTAKRPIWRNPAQLRFETTPLASLYENAEFRLSIRYPADWERQDLNERDSKLILPVMFLSPTAALVRQNVNLVIEKLESPMTLAEYTELGIRNEKSFFEDFALVSSTTVAVGGSNRGQQIIFTASSESAPMKFEQVWFVRDKLAYVWTFADDVQTFDKNVATFERMLDNFIIR